MTSENQGRNGNRRLTAYAAVAGVVLTWLSSLVGAAMWAGAEGAKTQGRLEVLERTIDDHEHRQRVLEEGLFRIEAKLDMLVRRAGAGQ